MSKTTVIKRDIPLVMALILVLLLMAAPKILLAQEDESDSQGISVTVNADGEDAELQLDKHLKDLTPEEREAVLSKGVSVKVDLDSDEIEKLVESSVEKLPIADLKEYLLEKERLKNERGSTLSDVLEDFFIPIVAIVMVFGLPVFIVGLLVWSRYKRRQMMHQSIATMVEKGVEIPEHLFDEERRHPPSAMRRGVVLIGVGLGLIGFFMFQNSAEAIGIGLIPLLIGVAYLVVWKLEKPGDEKQLNKTE